MITRARAARRLEALEDRYAARMRSRRDALVGAWLEGMTLDDLELMETIAARLADGEPEAAILASLAPEQRARVHTLYADFERLKAAQDPTGP